MSPTKRRLPALFLAGVFISATPSAFAFSDVFEGVGYTLGCAGLMMRDSAQHVAVCNPKFPVPADLKSLTSNTNEPAAVVAAPPVVVPQAPTPAPAQPAAQPPVVVEEEPEVGCEVLGGFLKTSVPVLVAALDFEIAQNEPCNPQ